MNIAIPIVVSVLSFIFMRYCFWRFGPVDKISSALIWLIFARYIASGFPDYTFDPIVAGFSINSLMSIFTFLFGFWILKPKYFLLKYLVPIYLIIAATVLSGIMGSALSGLFKISIKWAYFIVIAIFCYHLFEKYGREKINLFLGVFFFPLVIQMIGFATGVEKNTEGDGSISIIGSYYHEAAFSEMILGFCVLLAMVDSNRWRNIAFFIGIFSLMLANYRSTIIAVVPILAVVVNQMFLSMFKPKDKWVGVSIALIFIGGFISQFYEVIILRFEDIGIFIENFETLIKPPEHYTELEKDIFSSRAHLWSQYIDGYLSQDTIGLALGHGPDIWQNYFKLYAHNTFVNAIFSYGLIGLLLTLYLLAYNLILSCKIQDFSLRVILISCHIGFFLLNLSTMPLWQIEGLIVYGIIVGFTWAYCGKKHQPIMQHHELISERQSKSRLVVS